VGAHTPASCFNAVVLPELSKPSMRIRNSSESFLRLRSSESSPCDLHMDIHECGARQVGYSDSSVAIAAYHLFVHGSR